MNSLFLVSSVITLVIIFWTLYSLDKLNKGYGAKIPPYFETPFVSPKKATGNQRLILLIGVIAGFITSIFGIILIVKSL